MTEGKALKELQRGSQQALAWFIDKYTPYVSTIIYNIIGGDMSEAEIIGVGMGTSGKTAAKGYYYFAAPIDIDQVAYIQWGDVQIPVN